MLQDFLWIKKEKEFHRNYVVVPHILVGEVDIQKSEIRILDIVTFELIILEPDYFQYFWRITSLGIW